VILIPDSFQHRYCKWTEWGIVKRGLDSLKLFLVKRKLEWCMETNPGTPEITWSKSHSSTNKRKDSSTTPFSWKRHVSLVNSTPAFSYWVNPLKHFSPCAPQVLSSGGRPAHPLYCPRYVIHPVEVWPSFHFSRGQQMWMDFFLVLVHIGFGDCLLVIVRLLTSLVDSIYFMRAEKI